MIDKLVLQIPFSRSWVLGRAESADELQLPDPWERRGVFSIDLRKLPFKRAASDIHVTVGRDGRAVYDEVDLYCPWESIPSSHGGLAMKVYDQGNGRQPWPYIEIKCSPAKLVQGHNVWGWDDLGLSSENMLVVLHSKYPWLFGGFTDSRSGYGVPIDVDHIRVSEIDITYSVSVPTEKHRFALISLLHSLSKGQTKARGDSYETTSYFGAKNSRLKKIKVYLKGPEIENDNADRKRRGLEPIPEHVAAVGESLVRFEATIKREWMNRRGMITNLKDLIKFIKRTPDWYAKVFGDVTADLWKALDGQVVKVMNDDSVYRAIDKVYGGTRGKTARVFGFYQAIRAVGFEQLKGQYPGRSWFRLVGELEMCGFSRATIQSLHNSDGATVIELPRLVSLASLGEPRPAGVRAIRLRDAA